MTFLGNAQLQAILNRCPDRVDVTVGATTVKGVVDREDEAMLQANPDMIGKLISVVVKTDALAGLTEGVAITVDGVAHKVFRSFEYGDGALTRAWCSLV